jgi:hypothetical protein
MPIPLLESQRRLREVGRIRMGDTEGNRPIRLDRFRLTSPDRSAMEEAAVRYGGTVTTWEEHQGQYELFIEAEELPVYVTPVPISQWYELWSGGGCQRRCDGSMDQISGGPCRCMVESGGDDSKRKCKPTTRVALWLYELTGTGVWRLETHGYYAAIELPMDLDILLKRAQDGHYVPARLAIEQRTVVSEGKTKRFPVPVIRTAIRLQDILLAGAAERTREVAAAAPVVRAAIAGKAVDLVDSVDGQDEPPGQPAVVAPSDPTLWPGPGQCARCHAPAGAKHGRPCVNRTNGTNGGNGSVPAPQGTWAIGSPRRAENAIQRSRSDAWRELLNTEGFVPAPPDWDSCAEFTGKLLAAPGRMSLAEFKALTVEQLDAARAELVGRSRQRRRYYAVAGSGRSDEEDRALIGKVLGVSVTTRTALTADQWRRAADALDQPAETSEPDPFEEGG